MTKSAICTFLLSLVALVISADASAQSFDANRQPSTEATEKLEQLLFDLPDLRFERVADTARHPTYMLNIRQAVDHGDPNAGHFYQRVLLVHRGFGNTNVINTNGYDLERRPSELFDMLESNFISVEHRYFGPSTPEPKNWDHLTIQQAAADYHYIRELLGQIYAGKWVSTGVSKGGETCTYYKFFFPDDVNVAVPYVAPFPIGLKDQRFYEFLDKMGTEECRKRIFQFQTSVLEHKAALVPRFKYYLKGRQSSVDLIGGPEAALELIVLEYPFSFWQSGKNCDDVPPSDADPEILLDHLIESGDYWYLLDDSTESLAAHYYQHATQLGYYGYRTDRFGDLIRKWTGEPSACFFPYDKDLPFDGSLGLELIDWLKGDARDIVFIYGETDTWTVAQAETGDNPNVLKFILKGKHHGNARIRQADSDVRKEIETQIRGRLK